VWRIPGERYLPACVLPTVKLGGGGITVCRCFSWNGLGRIVILHRNLNAEGYKGILTRYVLSMLEGQFGDGECLYQHDSFSFIYCIPSIPSRLQNMPDRYRTSLSSYIHMLYKKA
jgi:hypothetical protein